MSRQHLMFDLPTSRRPVRAIVLGAVFAMGISLLTATSTAQPAAAAVAAKHKAPNVTQRPDGPSAMLAAIAQHSRVENVGARTETSQTFANPNGSWTTTSYAAPVRLQRSDGSWATINTTLHKTANGSVAPAVGQPGVVFAGKQSGSGWHSLASFGEGDSQVSWLWHGPLPTPVLTGDTATYPSALPRVNVVVQATRSGFETSVVFTARPKGPVAIPLAIKTGKRITTKTAADGSVSWSAPGGAKAVSPAASMWDARTGTNGQPRTKVLVSSKVLAPKTTTASGTGLPAADSTFTTRAAPSIPGPAPSASPSPSAVAPSTIQSPKPTPPSPTTISGVAPSAIGGRGLPGSTTDLSAVLATLPAGARGWVLVPSAAVLNDPATVYPLRIDPSVTLTDTFDTWVESGVSTSNSTSTILQIGNAGTTGSPLPSRAFIQWDTHLLEGSTVSAATLNLYNSSSPSCTATQWQVAVTGSVDATTVWTTQPTWLTTPTPVTSTATKGFTGCAAGFVTANVQTLMQYAAANSLPTTTLGVQATNENDTNALKSFASADSGTNVPYISVTYNHTPIVPTSIGISGSYSGGAVGSTTPTLTTTVTDPDAGTVKASWQILDAGGSSLVWSGSTALVPSGQAVSLAVPSGNLVNGTTYKVQVRSDDGTIHSSWSPLTTINVDTTAPAAPSVSSTAYPSGVWATAPTAGNFTVSDTSTDVAGWQTSFDGGSTWTSATGGSPTTISLTPPAGSVTLQVEAVDTAGNLSAPTSYNFYVVGVTSPTNGDTTQKYITLNAAAPSAATGVSFQYSRDNGSTWTTIPVANVTKAGTTITSWPVTTTVSGSVASAPAQLVWDAATALGADAPVQIRAVFTGGTGWTTTNNPVDTLDSKAYGLSEASISVGIGSVSLVTGNLAVTSTDASASSAGGSIDISRTFNSLDPTIVPTTGPAIFGPGWTSTLASSQSDWSLLEDLGTQVRLTDSSGGKWYFTKSGSTYTAVGDAADAAYSLTVAGTTTLTFTLTDPSGGSVLFGPGVSTVTTPSLTTPKPYVVTSSAQAGVSGSSVDYYNTDGTPQVLFAPAPPSVTCTPTSVAIGCRGLAFTYTGTGSAERLSKVTLETKDDSGTAISTDIACYRYDGTTANRLNGEWDPRIGGSAGWSTTCGTTTLLTAYSFDSTTGRITAVSPPGVEIFHITYDSSGRFSTAYRTHNATYGSGTLTTTVEYGVSIASAVSTDSTHPDLSSGRISAWGQTDTPLTAAVVYPAGSTVSSTDLRDGTVYATDANGRLTNTASYSGTGQDGWRVDTNEYDSNGNVIRTLTPSDRDMALNPSNYVSQLTPLGLVGASSQRIATALDTRTFYDAAGVDETDTFGPAHIAQLSNGSVTIVRTHDHTDYGTVNYPTVNPSDWTIGAPLHTRISVTEGGSLSLDPISTNETDSTQTLYAYGLSSTDHAGWDLATPMSTTVENGATDITTQARYDANGKTVEQRQPSAVGTVNSPGTRVTTYYSVGANNPAACTSTAWYGQLCSTAPGAQPTTSGLPGLASTNYTYDALLRPATTTETVSPSGGGTSTRSTTMTYLNSGASSQLGSIAVSGGTGTAVATQTYTYHNLTGVLDTITGAAGNAEIVGPDDFGQIVSFTDGHGAKTTTTYDSAGRIGSVTWTQNDGTTVLGSTTYAYNGGTEHRGLVTSIVDSSIGTTTGTYNADGIVSSQTLSSGLSQNFTVDPTGNAVGTSWADASANLFLSDSRVPDSHGQTAAEAVGGADPGWTSRAYGYDQASRLTQVQETGDDGNCVTRTYNLDVDSNRTSSTEYPAISGGASAGSCTTTTTPTQTQSLSYDNADRMLSSGSATGIAYDAWGRVTNLPAQLSATPAAGDVTNTYYTNDIVHSIVQGTATRTWALDPSGRPAWMSTSGLGSTAQSNHYSNPNSTAPTWINDVNSAGVSTTHRYVAGLAGMLADVATTGATTATTVELSDLHGDVLRTSSLTATGSPDGSAVNADEFGVVHTVTGSTTPGPRYGWLGVAQRSVDSGSSGLILMGVRLYSPSVGRFLSSDPIYGGNANNYAYPADPINNADISGMATPGCTSGHSGLYFWAACRLPFSHAAARYLNVASTMAQWFYSNSWIQGVISGMVGIVVGGICTVGSLGDLGLGYVCGIATGVVVDHLIGVLSDYVGDRFGKIKDLARYFLKHKNTQLYINVSTSIQVVFDPWWDPSISRHLGGAIYLLGTRGVNLGSVGI